LLPEVRVPKIYRVMQEEGGKPRFVWSMGEGPFAPAAVAAGLKLRPDPKKKGHGDVEPDAIMDLDAYRRALGATQVPAA
jgi:hypothetical protein